MAALQTLKVSSSEESAKIGRLWALARATNNKSMKEDTIKEAYRVLGLSPPNQTAIGSTLAKLDSTFDSNPDAVFTGKVQLIKNASGQPNVSYDIRKIAQTARAEVLRDMYVQNFIAMASLARYQNNLSAALMAMPHSSETAASVSNVGNAISRLAQMNARIFEMSSQQQQDVFSELFNSEDVLRIQASMAGDAYETKMPGYVLSSSSQSAAFLASARNSKQMLQQMLAAKEALLRSQPMNSVDEGLLLVMDPVMSVTPAPSTMANMRAPSVASNGSSPAPRNVVDPRATPFPAFLAPILPDQRAASVVQELKTTGQASAETIQAAIGKKRAVDSETSDEAPSKNSRLESAFSTVRAASSVPTVTKAVLQSAAAENKFASPIAPVSVIPAIRPPVPSLSAIPTERLAVQSNSLGSDALTTAITQSTVQAMAIQASRRAETPMPPLESPSRNTVLLALAPNESKATIPVAIEQKLVRSTTPIQAVVAQAVAATSVEDTAMSIAETLKTCAVKGHSLHIDGKVDPITLLTAIDSAAIGEQRSGTGIQLAIRSTPPPTIVTSASEKTSLTRVVTQSNQNQLVANQPKVVAVNAEDGTAELEDEEDEDDDEIDGFVVELKVLTETESPNSEVFKRALQEYKKITAEIEKSAAVTDASLNGPTTSEEIVSWITRFVRQGEEFANSFQKVLAFEDDCLNDGPVSYDPDVPVKLLRLVQQSNFKLIAGDNGKLLVPFEAVAEPVQETEDVDADPTEDQIQYVTTIIPEDYQSVEPLGTYTFQDASTGNTNSISNATTSASGGVFERTLSDGKVQKYRLDGTFLNVYTVCAHSCDTMLVLGLKSVCAIAVYALPPGVNGSSSGTSEPIVLDDPVIIQVDDIIERWPLQDGSRVNMSVDIDAVAAIPILSEETAIFVRYGQFLKVIGYNRTGRVRVIRVAQPDVNSFTALHTAQRKTPPKYAENRAVVVVDDTWQLNNNYIAERTLGLEWREDAKAYSKVEAVWITPHYYIPCSTGSTSNLAQFRMHLLYAGVYGKALPTSYFKWMTTLRQDAAESKLYPNVFQRSLTTLATKNATNVAARNNLLASQYVTAVYCLGLSDITEAGKGKLTDRDVIKHVHTTVSGVSNIYADEDAEFILSKTYTQFSRLVEFYRWWSFTGNEPAIGYNMETLRVPYSGFNPITINNKPMMLAWKGNLLMLFSVLSTNTQPSDPSSLKTNARELVPFAIMPAVINVTNDDPVISKLTSKMMDFSWAVASMSTDAVTYNEQQLKEEILQLTTDQEYRDSVEDRRKALKQEYEAGIAKYSGMVLHQKKVTQEYEAQIKELEEFNYVIDIDNKEQLENACQRLHKRMCSQTATLIDSASDIINRVYSVGKLHPVLARSALDVIDSVIMSLPKNAKKERELLKDRVQFGREKLRAFEVLYKQLQDAGEIEETENDEISYATYCVNRFLVVRGSMVFIYTLHPGTLTESVELQNKRAANAAGTQSSATTVATANTIQQALYNYSLAVVPVGDLATTLKTTTVLPDVKTLPSRNLSSSSSAADPSLPTKMNIDVYGPQGNYDALQLQKVVDFGRPITCLHVPNVFVSKSNPQILIRFSFGPHNPDAANGNFYNESDRKPNGYTYGSTFNFEEFIRPDVAEAVNIRVPDRRRFTLQVGDVVSTYISKNGHLTPDEENSVRYSWAAACTYNRMIAAAESVHGLQFTSYVEPCDRLYAYISNQNFEQIFRMVRDEVWRAAHESADAVSEINPFLKPKNSNFVLTHRIPEKFGGKPIGEICAMGFRALMRWMILDSHDLEPGNNGELNRITTKEQLRDFFKEQDIVYKGDFSLADDISHELHDRNMVMGKKYTYPMKTLPSDIMENVDAARNALGLIASQESKFELDQNNPSESRSRKSKKPTRANVVSEDQVMSAILEPRAIVVAEKSMNVMPAILNPRATNAGAAPALIEQKGGMEAFNEDDAEEVATEVGSIDSQDEAQVMEAFRRKLNASNTTSAPAMSRSQIAGVPGSALPVTVKKEPVPGPTGTTVKREPGAVTVKNEPLQGPSGSIKVKPEFPRLPVAERSSVDVNTGRTVNSSSTVMPIIAPRSSSSAAPVIAPRESSSGLFSNVSRGASSAQAEQTFEAAVTEAKRKEFSKPAPKGEPRSLNAILLYESDLGKSYSKEEIAAKRAMQAATILKYTNASEFWTEKMRSVGEKKQQVGGIMLLFDTTEAEAKKFLPNYHKYEAAIQSVREQKIEEYRNSVPREQLEEALKALKTRSKPSSTEKASTAPRATTEQSEQKASTSAVIAEDSPMPPVRSGNAKPNLPFAVNRRRQIENEMKSKPLPPVDNDTVVYKYLTSNDRKENLQWGSKRAPRYWRLEFMQRNHLAFEYSERLFEDAKYIKMPTETRQRYEQAVASGQRIRMTDVSLKKYHQMIINIFVHSDERNTAFAVSEEFCTWTHTVLPIVAEQLVAKAPFVLTVTYTDLVIGKTDYRGPSPVDYPPRPGDGVNNVLVIDVPLRPYKWDGERFRKGQRRNPVYGQPLTLVEIADLLNVGARDSNHGVVILQKNNGISDLAENDINAILGDIWFAFRSPRTPDLLKRQIQLAYEAIYRKTICILAAVEFGLMVQNVPLNWENIPVVWYHREKIGEQNNNYWYGCVIFGYAETELEMLYYLYLHVVDKSSPGKYGLAEPSSWLGGADNVKVEDVEMSAVIPSTMEVINLEED